MSIPALIARPLGVPGIMVVTTEDATVGSAADYWESTWELVHAAGAGCNTTGLFTRTQTYLDIWLSRENHDPDNQDPPLWARLVRGIIVFPTTGIDAAAIATENSYVRLRSVMVPQHSITGQNIVLTPATPASTTTLAHTDYLQCPGTPKWSTPVAVSSFENNAYVAFRLTAAGAEALTTAIAAQDPFVVCVQIESDADDATPTITSPTTELSARALFASLNHATASYRPVLLFR